jgi:hypothetical protein
MALLQRATRADLSLARDSLALITARGFHRDKDLAAELDACVKSLSDSRPKRTRRKR